MRSRKHPKVFTDLYVNMVAAGEAGGILDTILMRLATFLEKADALMRKVKGAMIYPAVISGVAVLLHHGAAVEGDPGVRDDVLEREPGAAAADAGGRGALAFRERVLVGDPRGGARGRASSCASTTRRRTASW